MVTINPTLLLNQPEPTREKAQIIINALEAAASFISTSRNLVSVASSWSVYNYGGGAFDRQSSAILKSAKELEGAIAAFKNRSNETPQRFQAAVDNLFEKIDTAYRAHAGSDGESLQALCDTYRTKAGVNLKGHEAVFDAQSLAHGSAGKLYQALMQNRSEPLIVDPVSEPYRTAVSRMTSTSPAKHHQPTQFETSSVIQAVATCQAVRDSGVISK